jgi:molybdenum cofactor cytidylyltransferase
MKIKQSLRAEDPYYAALVGAGGKTTALFQLARQLHPSVLVTTTTHLSVEQANYADQHYTIEAGEYPDFGRFLIHKGVVLVSGPPSHDQRLSGLSFETLNALYQFLVSQGVSLLVEADGSRRLPLKAPGPHEPAVPPWVKNVIVCAGLSGIGQPLDENHVHRPSHFARISGAAVGNPVEPSHLVSVLIHQDGGLKGIPENARRIVLLNQAVTADQQSIGNRMAKELLHQFDAVLVGNLLENKGEISTVHEPTAGIILAAGGSSRYGKPKILLPWQGEPIITKLAKTALTSGLSTVIVVLGAHPEPAINALEGLPVQIVINPLWEQGQSGSIRAGVSALPGNIGSALFLLADQPQVNAEVIETLIRAHQKTLAPIVAPIVGERRANPVLFDRLTFPDLLRLEGDQGGRAIFDRYPLRLIPIEDESLLLDIDTPEDYNTLMEMQGDE